MIYGLACPRCHSTLEDHREFLRCTACKAEYPVQDGIPSFLRAQEPNGAQKPALDLSVIIPALNEAASLTILLPRLKKALDELGVRYEVLVVNGKSSDQTAAVAERQGAHVINQTLPGYGGALQAGFKKARGDYILTLDADGSHDPQLLAELWKARESAEVLVASRYIKGGSADMPLYRNALSRILNVTFRRGLSLPVADISSGYRLYHRHPIQEMQIRATNFDVLEEILIRAIADGYSVREVPLRYAARVAGKSHVDLLKFGLSYLRTFGGMWRLRNSIQSADYDARAYDSIVPLQRYWQRARYRTITRMAGGFEHILDVGCGSSRIIGSAKLVGLDIQLHKLRYARRFGNPLVQGSIFELPFADNAFDCVICSEVIEHVPADEKVFSELERVLKPGGRLILGTPDYDKASWRFLEWLYKKVSPGGYADEHITHYSRPNLERYLEARGFKSEEVAYVGGSEMIFSMRKLPSTVSADHLPPVTTGLRTRTAPRPVSSR